MFFFQCAGISIDTHLTAEEEVYCIEVQHQSDTISQTARVSWRKLSRPMWTSPNSQLHYVTKGGQLFQSLRVIAPVISGQSFSWNTGHLSSLKLTLCLFTWRHHRDRDELRRGAHLVNYIGAAHKTGDEGAVVLFWSWKKEIVFVVKAELTAITKFKARLPAPFESHKQENWLLSHLSHESPTQTAVKSFLTQTRVLHLSREKSYQQNVLSKGRKRAITIL